MLNKKTYEKRFEKLIQLLSSDELLPYARQNNNNTFSRIRKMPLKDILLCCLAKKGLTTDMELRKYFKEKNEISIKISKQGYLQQRKRLNPNVFSYLNKEYLYDFYHSKEPKLWNGFLLLAIDGSKMEIPNSKENRELFGETSNKYLENTQTRALVSGIYDVLNGFYLNIEIAHICVSETELAKKNIKHLKDLHLVQPVLILFDRGYPSIEFIDYLEAEGIQYLFRLSSNDYKKEREDMDSLDQFVTLQHTYPRLVKIKKRHPERFTWMKEKHETHTRISNITLPSGKNLTLMTSLSNSTSKEELQELYCQRWEIEKKYHTLKNKLKLESVTGKSSIYVYQDFYAQVLVYNMVQDIRHSANLSINVNTTKKYRKYPMHTNENIAIGLLKDSMIQIFLERSRRKREKLILILQQEIEMYLLPIRKMPCHGRKKNFSNKYKNNQKSSF